MHGGLNARMQAGPVNGCDLISCSGVGAWQRSSCQRPGESSARMQAHSTPSKKGCELSPAVVGTQQQKSMPVTP
jgi:hypothetical protein